MQKLTYIDFRYSTTSAVILNTPDDSDYGFYFVFDIDYNYNCKDKTQQLTPVPVSRKINDVELGCREREKSRARTQKFNLDQNNKYEIMIH